MEKEEMDILHKEARALQNKIAADNKKAITTTAEEATTDMEQSLRDVHKYAEAALTCVQGGVPSAAEFNLQMALGILKEKAGVE